MEAGVDSDSLWKTQAAFGVALLAIVISLGSVVDELDAIRIDAFGDEVRMSYGFWIMAAALGACIYIYSLALIYPHPPSGILRAAGVAYFGAVLTPIAFTGMWMVAALINRLTDNAGLRRNLGTLSVLILGAILIVSAPIAERFAAAAHRQKRARERIAESLRQADRAAQLHGMGIYDHAAQSALDALVTAARSVDPTITCGDLPHAIQVLKDKLGHGCVEPLSALLAWADTTSRRHGQLSQKDSRSIVEAVLVVLRALNRRPGST